MPAVVFYNGTHVQDGPDNFAPAEINFLEISASVLAALSAILCFVVISSILWSTKTRVEGFNLYLVFHLVPDVCYNLLHIAHRVIKMRYGVYQFPFQCIIINIFGTTYTSINFWMNVLIAHEIYQILDNSHQARRFKPSSSGVVLRRVSIVYVLTIILAILGTVNTKPLYDVRLDSRSCVAKPYDTKSTVISYTILSLITVIPCMYLIYITYIVHKKKLLPPSGKHRFIALYFFRIAFVAVFITVTCLVTIAFGRVYIYAILLTIEGIIVSSMSLTKNDVHAAVLDTFCCCCCNDTFCGKRDKETNGDRN